MRSEHSIEKPTVLGHLKRDSQGLPRHDAIRAKQNHDEEADNAKNSDNFWETKLFGLVTNDTGGFEFGRIKDRSVVENVLPMVGQLLFKEGERPPIDETFRFTWILEETEATVSWQMKYQGCQT